MDSKDHDMLITVNTNVENLCKKFDKFEQKTEARFDKMEADTKERFDSVESKIDNKNAYCMERAKDCFAVFVKSKTFWTVGIALFVLICGAYGYASYILDYVAK